MWKAGGGDPFIDTLPSPINNDPDSVRYQELFQGTGSSEKDELVLDDLPPQPSAEFPKNLEGVRRPVELGEEPSWDLECSFRYRRLILLFSFVSGVEERSIRRQYEEWKKRR